MDAEKIATRALGAILVENGATSHMLIKEWIEDAIAAAVDQERAEIMRIIEDRAQLYAKGANDMDGTLLGDAWAHKLRALASVVAAIRARKEGKRS